MNVANFRLFRWLLLAVAMVQFAACGGNSGSNTTGGTNTTTAPSITSAATATFTIDAAWSFTVTATGNPPPTLSYSGTLPAGLTFNAATGVLSGIPTGLSGNYPLTFMANNGVPPSAAQNFTLTVKAAPVPITYCDEWHKVYQGQFILYNNTWGKCNSDKTICISDFSQCVSIDNTTSPPVFSWTWRWPSTADNRVKAAPEVIYGYSPWNSSSTTQSLPKKISDINKAIISFDITVIANGHYNLAIDMWTTSQSIPSPATKIHEIILWLDATHWNHDITQGATRVTINNEEYYLKEYPRTKDGVTWGLIQISRVVPKYSGSVNIHGILSYLLSTGYVGPDEYLDTIEPMNEIKDGNGATSVRNLSIEVN